MDVMERIAQQVKDNTIILYMKGSPDMPLCGFSARAVEALSECGEKFAYVDVIADPEIRANLPKFADWPTFPQLYVKGELVGGCDIISEMAENGELKTLVKEAAGAA